MGRTEQPISRMLRAIKAPLYDGSVLSSQTWFKYAVVPPKLLSVFVAQIVAARYGTDTGAMRILSTAFRSALLPTGADCYGLGWLSWSVSGNPAVT